MMALHLEGGFHPGPLFTVNKRRSPKRYGTIMQGRLRRQSEKRATPAWIDRAAVNRIYRTVKRMNKTAGGQVYNVGHIVPLLSHYVCGLHVETNMCIQTREENARLSNLTWPDMPETQLELPLWDSHTAATSARQDTTWPSALTPMSGHPSASPAAMPNSISTMAGCIGTITASAKACTSSTA